MGLFKEEIIDLGTIKAKSSKEVVWHFDELKKSDIGLYFENNKWNYAVYKTCNCQGEILISEKTLNLIYTDKGFAGDLTKNITVYLKNGDMPIRVQNERGEMVFNQSLGFITLYFKVKVVL